LPPKPKKKNGKRRVVVDTSVLVAGISGFKGRTFQASIRVLMYSSTGPTRMVSRGWLLKTSWTSTKKFLSGEMFVRP